MSQTVEAYDPNAHCELQTVEITLMQWKYKATFTEKVGGNCHGLTVMDCALGNLLDKLIPDDDGPATVKLTADDGDTLICQDDFFKEDAWLKDMTVSLRIIAMEPEIK